MDDAQAKIIVALIGFFGSIAGVIIGYFTSSKKQLIDSARREQAQKDQFERLFAEMSEVKKRLDEHNHYAEKFGNIEKTIIGMGKDLEYLRKEVK